MEGVLRHQLNATNIIGRNDLSQGHWDKPTRTGSALETLTTRVDKRVDFLVSPVEGPTWRLAYAEGGFVRPLLQSLSVRPWSTARAPFLPAAGSALAPLALGPRGLAAPGSCPALAWRQECPIVRPAT